MIQMRNLKKRINLSKNIKIKKFKYKNKNYLKKEKYQKLILMKIIVILLKNQQNLFDDNVNIIILDLYLNS